MSFISGQIFFDRFYTSALRTLKKRCYLSIATLVTHIFRSTSLSRSLLSGPKINENRLLHGSQNGT